MSLDNELKEAMRRVPAPEGFAERVLARVDEPRRDIRPMWWRAAAATFLLAAIAVAEEVPGDAEDHRLVIGDQRGEGIAVAALRAA